MTRRIVAGLVGVILLPLALLSIGGLGFAAFAFALEPGHNPGGILVWAPFLMVTAGWGWIYFLIAGLMLGRRPETPS